MDELTMFAALRPDSEVLPADERAALRVSLLGHPPTARALTRHSIAAHDRRQSRIDADRTRTDTDRSGPRRRSRRVTHVVLAIAVAAAVVTTMVVISRDDTTSPADTAA